MPPTVGVGYGNYNVAGGGALQAGKRVNPSLATDRFPAEFGHASPSAVRPPLTLFGHRPCMALGSTRLDGTINQATCFSAIASTDSVKTAPSCKAAALANVGGKSGPSCICIGNACDHADRNVLMR